VKGVGTPSDRGRAELLTVILGVALGVAVVDATGSWLATFRPEDAGLGRNTFVSRSSYGGLLVSGLPLGDSDLGRLQDSFRRLEADGDEIALWLGASQLHAITYPSPGDQVAAYYADQLASRRHDRLAYIQMSSPNASLHDLLAMYLLFRQARLVPSWLLVAIVYDDLREDEPQRAILEQLDDLHLASLERLGDGIRHLVDAKADLRSEESDPVDRNPLEGTPQQQLEDRIVSGLEDHWDAFRERGKLPALIRLSWSRLWSNLRVDRRRIPVPPRAQEWNMTALATLIALTREDGVELLVYKQPFRPGLPVFYHDRSRYDAFFDRLERICHAEDVHYADFEWIVPEEFWGLDNGNRPDVFHFQARGHRNLAQAVDGLLAQRSR